MTSHLSSLLGRATDLDAITALLKRDDCRLVTVVGLGGVGKTSIARQMSHVMENEFDHGVFFIPLVKITNPDDIAHVIIQTLSMQTQPDRILPFDQLTEFLSEREVLLIFDNFEQLLNGVHIVGELLASTSRLKLLITSREVLNLADEWIYRLEGIAYPENGHEGSHYPAIQLFEQQANRIRNDFNLNDHLEAVIEICRLVRGNPLAIELAASWSNVLVPSEIASEIQANVSFLEGRARDMPKRHRSVRSVFRHSWQLLPEDEKVIFRRLSLFSGDFDRRAAASIAGASLSQLTALVDKSLVHMTTNGRYEIHELLRQFGYERLEASDEADMIRDEFVHYYLNFLCLREENLKGHGQVEALDEIEPEFENIRRAWQWAVEEKQYELLEKAIESLHFYCDMRNRYNEAHQLISDTLTQIDEEQTPLLASKLEARRIRLYLFNTIDRHLEPLVLLQDCIAVAEAEGDVEELAFAKLVLLTALFLSKAERHELTANFDIPDLIDETISLFEQLNDPFYVAEVLNWKGASPYMQQTVFRGNEQARDAILGSYNTCREIGDVNGMAWSLATSLHKYHRAQGDYVRARQTVEAGLARMVQLRSKKGTNLCKGLLSAYMALNGELEEAYALAQETFTIGQNTNDRVAQLAGLAILSFLSCIVDHDYEAALRYFEQMSQVYTTTIHTFVQIAIRWGHCLALVGKNNFTEARSHYASLVYEHYSPETDWLPDYYLSSAVICFICEAIILTREGDAERAVELLGLIDQQPPEVINWLDHWEPARTTRAELRQSLGDANFEVAWHRGAAFSVEDMIFKLTGSDLAAHALDDNNVLTEREFEILELLSEGFTNREIGERLFISIGTVKVHTRNIYEKLAVNSRDEAAERARQLRIL